MSSPDITSYLKGFYNVLTCGARGDGTGDDSSAFAAANTYAAAAGGVVYIPPGTYRLGSAFSGSVGVAFWKMPGVTFTGAGSFSAGSGYLLDFSSGMGAGALTATAAWTAGRFVQADLNVAAVDSITVIGIAPVAVGASALGPVASSGVQLATADAPLALGDYVKVGTAGRATKWTGTQTTLQTAITGEATAFSQPGAATVLDVAQAADVAADRGRVIVVEGSNGAGAAIAEEIALNAANSSTTVTGATSFTKVSAVYTKTGTAIGAQAITVKVTGGATICTLAGGSSELGADIPAQTVQAYCNEITVTGPNADATFITIVGTNSADAVARERVQLDGASPSKITTTTVFRVVSRICLGEFTNAAAGAVKTNSTVDTAGMKCGVCLAAAAARGDNAQVLVKPNV